MEIPQELLDQYAGRTDVEFVPFEGKYSTGWIIRVGKPTEYHVRQALELIKMAAEMRLRQLASEKSEK